MKTLKKYAPETRAEKKVRLTKEAEMKVDKKKLKETLHVFLNMDLIILLL